MVAQTPFSLRLLASILLLAGFVRAADPPVIPVGLDAYRMWDRWPYQVGTGLPGSGTARIYDPWSNEWSKARLSDGRVKLPEFSRSIVISAAC
jgi:hypothetical protein